MPAKHHSAWLSLFLAPFVFMAGCGTTPARVQNQDGAIAPAGNDTDGATVDSVDASNYELVAEKSVDDSENWAFSVASVRSAPSRDNLTFHWDFGDGAAAVGRIQNHRFVEPGTYLVKVSAARSDSSIAFELAVEVTIGDDGETVVGPAEVPVGPAGVDPPAVQPDVTDDEPVDAPEPDVDDPVVVTPLPPPPPPGGGVVTPPPPPTGPCTTDADGDGVMDCNDGCPNDARKGAPGICGCGVLDLDSDNDATPNCNDGCPNDAQKVAAGACGCGVADTDANQNGTADCLDPPPGGSSGIGINLAKTYGWGTQITFVDVFKQGRAWESYNTSGGSATGVVVPVDANGYPLEIPYNDGVNPPQMVRTVMLDVDAGTHPTGTFTLIFEGDGDIHLGGAGSGDYSSSGAQRTVSFNVTSATSGISLTITRSNAVNPIRYIRVIMPGHLATYQTQPFYPPLLDRLQGFSVIRFMEWIRTNDQRRLVTWSDRPTTNYVTNAGPMGGAYEYAIRLANAVGADSWLTVPHLADDNFIRELARLALAELAPGRKVYIEYSNEVWNGMFEQATYARDTGLALGLHTNSTTAGRRFTAKRSAEIFRIFEEEFDAQSSRVVKVIPAQAGSASVASEILATFQQASVNGVPVNPWGVQASVLAIAPYFGNGLADQIVTDGVVNTITTAEILQRARETYLPQALSRVSANKVVADQYGLPLLSYEGGQHIVGTGANQNNATLTAKLLAANRDPGMYDLYRDYIDGYFANGGTLFVHYSFCSVFASYGSWGSMETLDQPLSQAPKYEALLDSMQP